MFVRRFGGQVARDDSKRASHHCYVIKINNKNDLKMNNKSN